MTDLSFIKTIMDSHILNYQNEIAVLNPEAPPSFNRTEVMAEKIAALQLYKQEVIKFIADSNKIVNELNEKLAKETQSD